jgi:hypothetical protein
MLDALILISYTICGFRNLTTVTSIEVANMEQITDREATKRLLETLLVERAELDLHIAFLRKRLGASEEAPAEAPAVSRTADRVGVKQGEFFGLSRAEAAIKLLSKYGQALSTNDIAEKLRESGLESMFAKNALTAMYTSLSRHQEVCRVSKNTWGLKKWYPHLKDKKKNGGTQETSEQVDGAGVEENIGAG